MGKGNLAAQGATTMAFEAESSLESLPLLLESYPPELQLEVAEAIEAVLSIEALPAGEDPLPNFPSASSLKPLPSLSHQVVGVSGKPHSGKDVFADYMIANYERVERLNFSDPIIEEVNLWLAKSGRCITAGNKSHPAHRKLLQVWGRARRLEEEDYWTSRLIASVTRAKRRSDLVIVAGVRAPSDLALVESSGGVCLRVERPGNPYQAEDAIEQALDDHADQMIGLLNPSENDLEAYVSNIELLLKSGLSSRS